LSKAAEIIKDKVKSFYQKKVDVAEGKVFARRYEIEDLHKNLKKYNVRTGNAEIKARNLEEQMKEQTAKCEKQINELKKLKLQDFPGLENYITYQTDNGLDMDQIVNKMVSLEELLKEINKNYIEIQKN